MIIRLTIDRFENDQAVLISHDGQTIIWPKDKLPAGARDGLALNFEIMEDQERGEKDRQAAKDIINEIINQP
ncbi:MAG: DUF3006 domain-containing protein [bacterium]|nr:DUF3006 domain-containing protein [bacterium]